MTSAVDLGFTTTSTETEVRTDTQTTTKTTTEVPDGIAPGLLGYDVVNDLQSTGAISSYTREVPQVGWESEFRLDQGDAIVRFRERVIRWIAFRRALNDPIEQAAGEHGAPTGARSRPATRA